jgi:uncharacterized protein (DUF427 family)
MPLTLKSRETGLVLAHSDDSAAVRPFEGNLYFAPEAVSLEHLKVTERTYTCPYKGTCYWIDLVAPGAQARDVAWVYRTPKPGYEFIRDQIGFYGRDTAAVLVESSATA